MVFCSIDLDIKSGQKNYVAEIVVLCLDLSSLET